MQEQSFFDSSTLKTWFKSAQRDLPWRQNPTPYAVWISEVMLQQTQVAVVVPYFERWMTLFPSVEALACAPLEIVLKAWEGLGYYSRARNLHAGACYLKTHFQSTLPEDADKLKAIKGLGPYTIGAIRSFAFHHKTAAVDGNVYRVLARYFLIEEDIGKKATQQKIWTAATSLLPDEEPWVVNEALIELGATICSKKPKCTLCPIRTSCAARIQGRATELPIKANKSKTAKLQRHVAVIKAGKHLLVRKGKPGEIMFGLQEFPYFSTEVAPTLEVLQEHMQMHLGVDAKFIARLPQIAHSFTRYQATLFPLYFTCDMQSCSDGYSWQTIAELDQQAFSAGHRRIYADWKLAFTSEKQLQK